MTGNDTNKYLERDIEAVESWRPGESLILHGRTLPDLLPEGLTRLSADSAETLPKLPEGLVTLYANSAENLPEESC